MTSSKFGVERETFHKEDYESFPLPKWESLGPKLKTEILELSAAIVAGQEPWQTLDDVVARIYGLSKADRQLIADSMEYALPHTEKKDGASARPNDQSIAAFLAGLASLMKPFIGKRSITIKREKLYDSKSFEFFSVVVDGQATGSNAKLAQLAELLSAPLSASQIRIQLGSGRWLIGQLAQRRYWSLTRARLLALEWIESGFLGKDET